MARSRRKWNPDVDGPLAAEVAHVGVNGVAWFQPASRQSDEGVAQLRAKAGELFGDRADDVNLETLLDDLLSKAIAELASPALRATALVFLGLKSDIGYRKPLMNRQGEAASRLKITPTTFRQKDEYERSLIVDIGNAIEKLSKSAPERGSVLDVANLYVHRPTLESQINDALRDPGVVVLVGEGGVGKTTLAREFTASKVGAERCVFVAVGSLWELVLSLRNELTRLHIDVSEVADSALIIEARRLFESRGKAPHFVILDGMEDWKLVKPLLPQRPLCRIIITARREFAQLPCRYIEVKSLEHSEVDEMVRLRLPDASYSDLTDLECLQGRAIAIEHVCSILIQKSSAERRKYMDMLFNNTAGLLNSASGRLDEQALSAVYRQIVGELENNGSTAHAARLLKLYLVYGFQGQHCTYLEHCMGVDLEREEVDIELGRELFRSAIEVLLRWRLVEVSHNEYGQRVRMRMHDVTFFILREVFGDSIERSRLEVRLLLALQAKASVEHLDAALGDNLTVEEREAIALFRGFEHYRDFSVLAGLHEGFAICFAAIHEGYVLHGKSGESLKMERNYKRILAAVLQGVRPYWALDERRLGLILPLERVSSIDP